MMMYSKASAAAIVAPVVDAAVFADEVKSQLSFGICPHNDVQ